MKLRPLQNDVLEIRLCEARPQLQQSSSNEQLNQFEIRAATAPCCFEHQLHAVHATLSLSEVPGCESSMMKAWLSCLESARMSVGAAIGSMASIFDVFMVGGGRQRGRSSREGEFSVGPLLLGLPRRDLACEFGAPPQSHMPIFSSVTLLVRRQSVCRPITPFWPCPYTYSDFESGVQRRTSGERLGTATLMV